MLYIYISCLIHNSFIFFLDVLLSTQYRGNEEPLKRIFIASCKIRRFVIASTDVYFCLIHTMLILCKNSSFTHYWCQWRIFTNNISEVLQRSHSSTLKELSLFLNWHRPCVFFLEILLLTRYRCLRRIFKKNIYEFLHVIIKQFGIARTDIYFFWIKWLE